MNPRIQRTTILSLLIGLGLACFGLLPQMQAVSPTPDGCYPGFTTAEGCNALKFLTTGAGNTGVGWYSLFVGTTNNFNTGVGAGTLVLNTADSNTAVGAAALLLNSSGPMNTAVGTDALVHNDIGDSNTAVGAFALFTNAGAGISNNAIGRDALFSNTTGSFNEAIGVNALGANTTGSNNVAIGDDALFNNTGTGQNTAVGQGALANQTTGDLNTALGFAAGLNQTTGTNNIYIGDMASNGESNVIAIGALSATGTPYTDCFIGGIFGNPNPGVAVFIDAAGHLSTTASSLRFKDEIKPMDKTSEAIYSLKPVTFRYKKEFDRERIPQFGLIAEEVEKVNPALIARDGEGRVYSVRYEQVNAMLLNEFLKEHRRVQEQEATIAQLKKDFRATVAQLTTRLDEQAAQIQKVSAQLEVSKPAPRTVLNNR